MRRLAPLIALALLVVSAPLFGQAPGAFPHLVLDDSMGTIEPGGGLGPFDNTGVFPIASGQVLQSRISYDSLGQSNDNVLWALLVSGAQTPYPTSGTPEPPLFTQPPFILIVPPLGTLQLQPDSTGLGVLPLFIPPSIAAIDVYVQGLIFDVTSSPRVRLSNGLTMQITTPAYNAHVDWLQNSSDGAEAFLRNVGTTDIDKDTLNTLLPLGPMDPPIPSEGVGPPLQTDDFRFLPILPNAGDEPINPMARPMTKLRGAVAEAATTIDVDDTRGFPTSGRLLIQLGSYPWGNKVQGGTLAPNAEVVVYDGKTKDQFLNCQRKSIGSTGSNNPGSFNHADGELVLGFFTMATTSGARARTRVGLDADNEDTPHIVIPPFTIPPAEGGPIQMDLDLYRYETKVNKIQAYVVFDRVTDQWREIPGTANNELQGRWDPMVCIAPDGRSMIATLKRTGGVLGWDNITDHVVAIRLDGTNWKATGTPVWTVTYQTEADPVGANTTARSRQVYMPAVSIIGPDPDNYVAFIGLKHKWKHSVPPAATMGANSVALQGYEGVWVNEEIIVRDFIDLPLVRAASTKAAPIEPRPWITNEFGQTGLGSPIIRFDPNVLASPSHTQLLVTPGAEETEEDLFLIRNVSITAGGLVKKTLVNVSGYSNGPLSVGKTRLRPFYNGGHGQGRKAAFSPDESMVAWVANDNGQVKDWVNVAHTNGADSGKVSHVYRGANGKFKVAGDLENERAVSGLRWLDSNRLSFLMGRMRYADPIGANPANPVNMDLFVYDVAADLLTNLTKTDGAGGDLTKLGKINPAGFFQADDGSFAYVIRAGGVTTGGGTTLAANTPVMNIIGLNATTLNVFNATGDEFTGSSPIPNIEEPAAEIIAPIETAFPMRFTEGYGSQDALVYFTGHRVGGNGADDVMAFHREIPFIAFAATNVQDAGSHISNLTPNPFGNTVAFARTQGTDPYAGDQHPFVVDLNSFLFVRDLAPLLVGGGGVALGRVMNGSLGFLPPSGNASSALTFSMGIFTHPSGIAYTATPVYYSLATVSDVTAEPVPQLVPLMTTAGLVGTPWRFYDVHAGLSKSP